MTVKEAQNKLTQARKRQQQIRLEIDRLREFLRACDHDPDVKVDLVPRNAAIYQAWKSGKSNRQVAKEFKLSPGRVYNICRRVQFFLKNKTGNFEHF